MYNKLFYSILDSTIWLESDTTRIVFITFLASMDEDGFARFGTIENLASRARVSIKSAQIAVKTLESPDKRNPNQEYEGRRIERVPGGWMILNAPKYRETYKRAIQKEQNRIRVARYRAKKGLSNEGNALLSLQHDDDVEYEIAWNKERGFSGVSEKDRKQWAIAYPACNIDRQLASMHEWLLANPTRAKKSNWRKFVTTWLSRQQDRGGDHNHGAGNRRHNATNRNEGTLNAGRASAYRGVGKV